jgi:hypothetical protein
VAEVSARKGKKGKKPKKAAVEEEAVLPEPVEEEAAPVPWRRLGLAWIHAQTPRYHPPVS